MMHESLSSLIALSVVIPLIILCAWVLRKWYIVPWKANQYICILEQIPLSAKERLLLVQVKQDVLLLGVTPQSISTLHVLKEPLQSS